MIKCYWQVKIKKNWNDLTEYSTTSIFARVVGEKFFELTNHLGNVHMTLSDYRRAESDGIGVKYYSQVATASEYYPPVGGHGPDFGMLLTNGNYSSGSYRFGFNGMEMDDEVKGTGNSYNTLFRQYDPRLGRWMSLDPAMAKYPGQSPYVGIGNNPIFYMDPLGDSINVNLSNWFTRTAFNLFMKTSLGRSYIGRYAAKGQTVAGHTFEEDGEYHTEGVDLLISDDVKIPGLGRAENGDNTNPVSDYAGMKDGRLKLHVILTSRTDFSSLIYKNYNKAREDGLSGWRLNDAKRYIVASRAKTLIHELFIHTELYVQDFIDNGNPYDHSYQRKNCSNWLNDHVSYTVELERNITRIYTLTSGS